MQALAKERGRPGLSLTPAALDRLTHRAHFVEITGASYRAEQTKQQLALQSLSLAGQAEQAVLTLFR